MPDGDRPIFGRGIPRVPPSNIQAEQALLGALLSNNPKVADKIQFLCPFHFADTVNGRIFERAMARIDQGQVADPITLKSDFENAGTLDDVGGVAYLVSLITAQCGWMVAGDYAKTIYDTWLRRELIGVCEEVSEAAYGEEPGADVRKMVDTAAESVLALGEHSSENRGTDFATVAAGAVARSEAAQRGDKEHAHLDTGIASIDEIWGGLWPADLYYLMARSRTGKTPLMMQIARHVARQLSDEAEEQNTATSHVHVFSLEMSAEALVTTNLASTTRWTADQIRAGKIDNWLEFERAAKRLGQLPIVIDDQADMDLPGLFMRAIATKRQRRTRLVLIDYRELVRRGREQSRMQLPEWVPYLGYQLKALAKRLNVPVIALAQINKTKSGEAPVRPVLEDLPYDGGQAADGVFALHRPELYLPVDPPKLNTALSEEKQNAAKIKWEDDRKAVAGVTEFIALKRRFGPTGYPLKLRFDGPRMLLREWNDLPPDDRWADWSEGQQ